MEQLNSSLLLVILDNDCNQHQSEVFIKETLSLFDANITDTYTYSGHTIIPKQFRRNFIEEIHIGEKGTWRENGACLEMPSGDLNICNFHLIQS